MGIIAKQVHKHRVWKLAAEQSFRTSRTPEVIIERLHGYADNQNAKFRALTSGHETASVETTPPYDPPRPVDGHYYVLQRGNDIMLAYGWPAALILGGDKNYGSQGGWLARFRVRTITQTASEIDLALLRWSTEKDSGDMKNRTWYEIIINDFILELPASPVPGLPRLASTATAFVFATSGLAKPRKTPSKPRLS